MRYRATLILLAICAILTAIILTLDPTSNPDGSADEGTAQLFGPEVQLADYLHIESALLGENNPRILRKPQDQPWQIEEPKRWPANPYHINQILNQIQFLPKNYSFTVDSLIQAKQNLSTYGLQEARLKLTLGWGGKQQTIAFGSPTEMGNKTYILGPDRKHVYAITQQLEKTLLDQPTQWRSQEVLTLPIIDVNTISLQINDNGNLTKIRLDKTDEEWSLQAPINTRANTPLVNNALNHLQNVKVFQFLDAKDSAEAQAALLKPDIRITLHGTRNTQTLHLAEPIEPGVPHLYAKLEDYPNTPFTVSAAPFRNLRNAQTYFRLKNFLHFNLTTISNISLISEKAQTTLQKLEGGDWQVQDPSEPRWAAAENTQVQKLLQTLLGLNATHFPNDAPSQVDLQRMGLESPLLTITLKTPSEDSQPLTLHFGRPESGEPLYAKLEDSPFVHELSNRTTDRLPAHPIHYRLRRILPNNPIPPDATLVQFKLSKLPGNEILLQHPPAEAPDVPNAPPEPKILNLCQHLKTLSAKDFLEGSFDPAQFHLPGKLTPWAYKLAATWQLPSGNEPQQTALELHLTPRLSGSLQGAGHPGTQTAFTLEQTTVDLLHNVLPGPNLPEEYRKPPQPEE